MVADQYWGVQRIQLNWVVPLIGMNHWLVANHANQLANKAILFRLVTLGDDSIRNKRNEHYFLEMG